MGIETGIEWTDATWNPIRGCSKVDLDCRNCYAEKVAARFGGEGQPYHGTVDSRGHWNGSIKLVPEHLADPLRWARPRKIFVNSMSDLFHEGVSNEHIAAIFGVMAATSRHTFQILTKRPERAAQWFEWIRLYTEKVSGSSTSLSLVSMCQQFAREQLPGPKHPADLGRIAAPLTWPLSNVLIGTSVGHSAAVPRINQLRDVPAAVRFLSLEPLHDSLGPIDLTGIGWVIVGGESGPNARPMHPDWVRSVRDQCVADNVPFFFKQWGEWAEVGIDGRFGPDMIELVADKRVVMGDRRSVWVKRVGKRVSGRMLDGREWNQFPMGGAR